jgi:hypothetical protein
MFRARQRGARLIDVTPSVVAVHQDHDYAHMPGIQAEAHADFLTYATEEIANNLALAGGRGHVYTIYDATEVLRSDGKLVGTLRPTLIWRRLKAWLRRAITMVRPVAGAGRRPARASL